MAVTRASVIKSFHDTARAHGDMRIAADYSLQIDGHEDSWLYIRSQFWPMLTAGEGIEVPTPLGAALWQPSQAKFHQQSSITMQESADGQVSSLFEALLECQTRTDAAPINSTARFNAWVYYGTPHNWLERARIYDAFLQAEPIDDPDWESRTQILTIPATIFYHFYGEYEKGTGGLCGADASSTGATTAEGAG